MKEKKRPRKHFIEKRNRHNKLFPMMKCCMRAQENGAEKKRAVQCSSVQWWELRGAEIVGRTWETRGETERIPCFLHSPGQVPFSCRGRGASRLAFPRGPRGPPAQAQRQVTGTGGSIGSWGWGQALDAPTQARADAAVRSAPPSLCDACPRQGRSLGFFGLASRLGEADPRAILSQCVADAD